MRSLVLFSVSFNILIFILRQIHYVDINKIAEAESLRLGGCRGSFESWPSDEQPEDVHQDHDWNFNIVRDEVDRIEFRVERRPSLDCKTTQGLDCTNNFIMRGDLLRMRNKTVMICVNASGSNRHCCE